MLRTTWKMITETESMSFGQTKGNRGLWPQTLCFCLKNGEVQQGGVSIMLLGCISVSGAGKLVKLRGIMKIMKKERYRKILCRPSGQGPKTQVASGEGQHPEDESKSY